MLPLIILIVVVVQTTNAVQVSRPPSEAVKQPKLVWSTKEGALGEFYGYSPVPSLDKRFAYFVSRNKGGGEHNVSRIILVDDDPSGWLAGEVVSTTALEGGIGNGFGRYSKPFVNPSTGNVLILGNFVTLTLYVFDRSLRLLSTVPLPQWGLTYNACDMIPMSEMFQLPTRSKTPSFSSSVIWVASLNSTNNATSVVGFNEEGQVLHNATSFTPTAFIDHSNLAECGFSKVAVGIPTGSSEEDEYDIYLGGYNFNKLKFSVNGDLKLDWVYSKTEKTPVYTYRFSFFDNWDVSLPKGDSSPEHGGKPVYVALKTYMSRVPDCCLETVVVLDAVSGTALFAPTPLGGTPYPIFSDSGQTFAVGGRKEIRVFDSPSGALQWSVNTSGSFQDRPLPVAFPNVPGTAFWFGSELGIPDPSNSSQGIVNMLIFSAGSNQTAPFSKIQLGVSPGQGKGVCFRLSEINGIPSSSGAHESLVLASCLIESNSVRVFAINPFPGNSVNPTVSPSSRNSEIEVTTFSQSESCSVSSPSVVKRYAQGCRKIPDTSTSTLFYCAGGALHSHFYSNSTSCSGSGSTHSQYDIGRCYPNPPSGSSLEVTKCG